MSSTLNSQNGQNGTDVVGRVDLSAQVSTKVGELHSGGAHVAGEWLATFQRSECAWQVCVDILHRGSLPGSVPLQFFASQTLARVSRAFTARLQQDSWVKNRGQLLQLLHVHSMGQPAIWRQLALAITCADLWLGSWTADGPLSASSLPVSIRRELLALPPELLFCERALPLDDAALWQHAAAALQESSARVFNFLLSEVETSGVGAGLSAVASWLRALRKGVEWLPHNDGRMPLRPLAVLQHQLLLLASTSPPHAAEVAQQLALWSQDCDAEVLHSLQPLLSNVLPSLVHSNHAALVPLLSDLAVDRWPRAILTELPLDWQLITSTSLDLMTSTIARALHDDLAGCEAEDVFGIWRLLGHTIKLGTWGWKVTVEQAQNSSCLCKCFELFCQRAVSALTLQDPRPECAEALFRIREAAESAIVEWASLFGGTTAWEEAIWQPLRLVRTKLGDGGAVTLELCQATEVAMWWASKLASSAYNQNEPCAASVIMDFPILDTAPLPWRAFIWSSACCLASTARGDICLQLLTWMLRRPPMASHDDVPWLLRHTELSYAQQVETLCCQMHAGGHPEHAERLAQLALEPVLPNALHDDSARARGYLLSACRKVAGGDANRICACLSQAVLTPLRQAVETEARARITSQWPAVQVLCAALAVTLPDQPKSDVAAAETTSTEAPVAIWEANWDMMQASLLTWAPSPITNQPVEAASEALANGAVRLAPLLKPALELLVRSIAESAQCHAQINAVHHIVTELRPPLQDLSIVATLVVEAVTNISMAALSRSGGLKQNPPTVEALFRLLAVSIQLGSRNATSSRLNQGHLRPLLLGQATLIKRCLEVAADALPDCPTPGGVEWTLVFVARLLKGLKEGRETDLNLKETMRLALPQLCLALTRALACQAQLTKVECVHYAAEVLMQVAEVFPLDVENALGNGLERLAGLGIPDYSRHRLAKHVAQRSQWANLGAWIDGLQQIAFDWQNERRQSIT